MESNVGIISLSGDAVFYPLQQQLVPGTGSKQYGTNNINSFLRQIIM